MKQEEEKKDHLNEITKNIDIFHGILKDKLINGKINTNTQYYCIVLYMYLDG